MAGEDVDNLYMLAVELDRARLRYIMSISSLINEQMARPLSEDKRQMILAAATRLFAKEGVSASTARIAKEAGVAEGTVFIYFPTKDDLLNQLYLELKSQLRLAYANVLASTDLRQSLWQFWAAYVGWGLAKPVERQAMANLHLSNRISGQTRTLAAEGFKDVHGLLIQAQALGGLREQPIAFVGALMMAMAEASIDLISGDRELHETTSADGFSAFWRAIATT